MSCPRHDCKEMVDMRNHSTFCGHREDCPRIDEHARSWRALHPKGGACFDWTPNEDRCPYHRE
jgi:hypothetical protein